MGEKMRLIPFGQLMNWILTEKEESGSIFGTRHFYKADPNKYLPIFNEKIETPIGPAAGPNSQLAQNIIASYVTGARFFEVKTVQDMDGDDLAACVARPCIDARDECYNTEWSTELYVPQAFEEYVKGHFACKLLAKEFGFGDPDGFVINMSVGYDFAGITKDKVNGYIEGMKNAANTEIFQECKAWTLANLHRFKNVDKEFVESITPRISDSITLSTLHGCPPQEIEKIASYLITEKGLNTFIKCNPTLLGYEFARKTMDEMGYDYMDFDDFHFNDDLQYEDAVPMLKRLQALADEKKVEFGVKITNTFPVNNPKDIMSADEMYMSGRALYPLSIEVANRLSRDFEGKLRISYSGGADHFNIEKIFGVNVWPITVATTLLKTGGYNRFEQLAKQLEKMEYAKFEGVKYEELAKLAEESRKDKNHIKPIKPLPKRKIEDKVPLTDCFIAPCRNGCPINQDIPNYIAHAGDGNYLDALRVIVDKNPLPFITGTICNHRCTTKCTRNFYEESVQIRSVKLLAAKKAYDDLMGELPQVVLNGKSKVAIVGGGPAGIAAAFFLGRYGIKSTIFEKRDALGGVVQHVIPEFRIPTADIQKDAELMKKMGAEVRLNTEVSSLDELRKEGFEYILLANGAWKPGTVALEKGEAVDCLEFLEACKKDMANVNVGKHVVVIGAGNTAMDTARVAKRLPGVEKVTIVYRRTKKYMPADEEELVEAIEDGVEFLELAAPKALENGKLVCEEMKLGEPDASGRRSPVATGNVIEVPCDTVIAAVGEKVDDDFYAANSIKVTKNKVMTDAHDVFVVGDASRGPATVVEAIADAQRVAVTIASRENQKVEVEAKEYEYKESDCRSKKGILAMYEGAEKESDRCLSCSCICENCVDVCPNRANISVRTADNRLQIVHMDGMCNECGNCATFCPYDSAPYLDKFTYFNDLEDFYDSKNNGFTVLDYETKAFRVRLDGKVFDTTLNANETKLPKDLEAIVFAMLGEYNYLLRK